MKATKEEIELRHIAPYLPYELKIANKSLKGDILNIYKMRVRSDYYDIANVIQGVNQIPILRPLSDLTKKIDLNDSEYWVPIQSIFHDYRKSLELKMSFADGMLNELWLDYLDSEGDYVQESIMGLKDWNILFEHHFDVFGLIEKGLAIDVNLL